MDRSSRSIDGMVKSLERLEKKMAQLGRSQQQMAGRAGRAAGIGGAIGGYFGGRSGGRSGGLQGSFRQAYARGQAIGGRAAGFMPVGEGFTGAALGAIPYLGPAFQATLSAAQNYYGIYSAFAQQRGASAGVTGGVTVAPGLTRLGIGLMQQPQFMAQLAQQSGRRGSSLAGISTEMAELQRYMGINAGGSFIGAMESGGVGARTNSVQLLQEAIAVGMARGVREAKLDQYLQATAQFAEQSRMQGIMLDPQAIESMQQLLPGGPRSGFGGRAGQQAAMNISQGLRRAGQGTDAFSFMAMRAAGYTGRPGGLSYMQAQLRLEEHPDEVFAVMMRQMMERGGDPEAIAAFLQQGARGAGINLSTRNVLSLAGLDPDALMSGVPSDMGAIERQRDRTRAAGQLQQFRATREQALGDQVRAAGADAAIQNQRVQVGATAATSMRRIMNRELQLVRQFLPMALSVVDGTIENITELVDAYKEGGFGGLLQKIAEMAAPNLTTNPTQATVNATSNALDPLSQQVVGQAMQSFASRAAGGDATIQTGNEFLDSLLTGVADSVAGSAAGQAVAPALAETGRRVSAAGVERAGGTQVEVATGRNGAAAQLRIVADGANRAADALEAGDTMEEGGAGAAPN